MEHTDERNERERLRLRNAVLEESVRSSEVECRASREMVLRLVAELEQERKKTANSTAALDSLKVQIDGLVVGRQSIDLERQTLNERVEAGRRVIEAARRESQCLEKQVEELEKKIQVAEGKLHIFLEKVAGLLQGNSQKIVQPTEGDILQKLDNLCNKTVSDLEGKLCQVSEELCEQTEVQKRTQHRAEHAELQVEALRERLQALEGELMTVDMHRDGLRHSQQHYEEFLEQLSETMKVDSIALDLGFDMRLKLILSRAEQLAKQEGSALAESKSLTYSLQRKLKSQKDQLESKGLHLQLLRKKVSELEEEKRTRSALAVARDDAQLEVRRLQKRVERLQGELRANKLSNTELKAQVSHTNQLKLKVMEQSQSMQEQRKKLEEVVEGKAEVEKRLSTVSSDLQIHERKTREDQERLDGLRQSLDQLSARQRDLVDFRTVVSQMLGLEAAALDLPDSEIITLLESLLHAHYHHHLHHHVNGPWFCSAHQRPHLLQIQDLRDTSSSSLPGGYTSS